MPKLVYMLLKLYDKWKDISSLVEACIVDISIFEEQQPGKAE